MPNTLYIALGEANEPKWYGLASGVGHMVMTPIATVGGDHIGSGTMITVCGNKPLDTDKVEHKADGSAMCKRCTSRLDKGLCADAIAMTMETDYRESGAADIDTAIAFDRKMADVVNAPESTDAAETPAETPKPKKGKGKAKKSKKGDGTATDAPKKDAPKGEPVDDTEAADVARIKADAAAAADKRGAKLPKYGKPLSERRAPVVEHNNGETRIGAEPANGAAIVRGSVGSVARGTDPKPRKDGAKPRGTTLDAPLGQLRFDPEVVGKKAKPHYTRTQRRNWQRKQAKAAQRAEAQVKRNNRTGR